MRRLSASLVAAVLVAGCDPYDSSLLVGGGPAGGSDAGGGPAGGTGPGGSGPGGSGPGGGGSTACDAPSDCPGSDNECGTRTCEGGVCGVDAEAAGTPTPTQIPGDCQRNVCDGTGSVMVESFASDVDDDQNPCTEDLCFEGAPDHQPLPEFTECSPTELCTADAQCVDCIDDIDCDGTDICTPEFTCVPATCDDGALNGLETDVDCGGPTCGGCGLGEGCDVDGDCLSSNCESFVCEPSCTDGVENQGETDPDCGGPCSPCPVGGGCAGDDDCESAICTATTCGEYPLKISEVRPTGADGTTDDYIELYNPRNAPMTLTSEIQVATRGSGSNYIVKFTGSGQILPARSHFLLAGGGFVGTADQKEPSGTGLVPDKPSVIVRRGATTLDAGCFHNGANPFLNANPPFICEGAPFVYVGGNSNRGFERGPGGALGNATDTNDTDADFSEIIPGNPQHLGSPPTP
jgi:hypothetical protein